MAGKPGDADHSNREHTRDHRATGLVAEKTRPRTRKPPLYKVLLLNDDFTPMEFVVILLMKIFGMSQEKAKQITLHVHTRGVGVCGVFPREIAETKVKMATEFAFQNQHPLKCTMEKE
ncbi:MAG: ATP-dependent Clp protease adapter ClpS [Gammaproteobacteria bacterium]|nr:ATP-dependent Clp protease adapter ClpS [Gammaproteobacteria bacterium]